MANSQKTSKTVHIGNGSIPAPGHEKKPGTPAHGDVIGATQLRQAERLLTRIERKGEALSASAERLLRRVS
jgi:hypothetical protein